MLYFDSVAFVFLIDTQQSDHISLNWISVYQSLPCSLSEHFHKHLDRPLANMKIWAIEFKVLPGFRNSLIEFPYWGLHCWSSVYQRKAIIGLSSLTMISGLSCCKPGLKIIIRFWIGVGWFNEISKTLVEQWENYY